MSVWTQDRIDHLHALWREGRTAAAIATTLGDGITRNAVLAKVWRLGLSRPQRGAGTASGSGAVRGSARSAEVSTEPMAGDATVGSATILSVRRSQCRWPLDDPAHTEFSLCGAAVCRGAYCAPHAAVAYRDRPPEPQRLMRLAEATS